MNKIMEVQMGPVHYSGPTARMKVRGVGYGYSWSLDVQSQDLELLLLLESYQLFDNFPESVK